MASTIQQPCVYNTGGYDDLLDEVDVLPFLYDSTEEENGTEEVVRDSSFTASLLQAGQQEESMDVQIDGKINNIYDRDKIPSEVVQDITIHGRQLPLLTESWRFWQLVVAALCCVSISSTYAANLYSGRVQEKYNFTQSQMTTISTISDIAGVLMIPFGIIYDHYGAQPIYFAALIIYPMYGILFGLALSDAISGSVPVFAVFTCMLSIGSSLLDMGSVMTLLSIFPANRGAVVAVMKTFCGMGSAILGAVHLAFFPADNDNDTAGFLYFLAVWGMIACFLGVLFVDVPPYMIKGCEKGVITETQRRMRDRIRRQYLRQKAPTLRFVIGFTVVLILTIFLPIQGAASAYMKLSHTQHVVFALFAVGLFLPYATMALPLRALDRKVLLPYVNGHMGSSGRMSRMSYISRASIGTRDSLAIARELDYIAPQYQTTVLQNLQTVRFWALLWTLFSVNGTQIVLIGNMRFVYGALAGKPLDESYVALLVVINGVGSGIGRVFLSFLEMATQGRPAEKRTAITFTLFIPIFLTLTALILLFLLPVNALFVPCFIISLANGCTAAVVVIVLRTIYAKDVAKHYNCCGISTIIASLLMNRVVYGEWYTRQAEKEGGTLCYGQYCVFMPLMFCCGMNLSALVSASFLHWDYKKYCLGMLEARRQRLSRGRSCAASDKNNNHISLDTVIPKTPSGEVVVQ